MKSHGHSTPRHGNHSELRFGGMSEADALNTAEGAVLRAKGRSITVQEGKEAVKIQRDLARHGKMTLE
jgi:hypothetical protein